MNRTPQRKNDDDFSSKSIINDIIKCVPVTAAPQRVRYTLHWPSHRPLLNVYAHAYLYFVCAFYLFFLVVVVCFPPAFFSSLVSLSIIAVIDICNARAARTNTTCSINVCASMYTSG